MIDRNRVEGLIREIEMRLDELRRLIAPYCQKGIFDVIRDVRNPVLLDVLFRICSDMGECSVGFLGPLGSYSHEVASRVLPSCRQMPFRRIEDVVKCVYNGECAYGVVPLENSQAGVVGESVDALSKWDVYVNFLVEYKVVLCLVVNERVKSIGDIRRVYSHPHAINEASGLLSRLDVDVYYTRSTAEALEVVRECDDCAAIASRFGASIYGLKPIVCGIEDRPNYTKFLIISREKSMKGDRTLLIFSIPNRPGSLYKALQPFALLGLNLSMIYSKPNRESPWGYDFVLEVECELQDGKCRSAIEELGKNAVYLRVLGSYSYLKLD